MEEPRVEASVLTSRLILNEMAGRTIGKDGVRPNYFRLLKAEHSPIRVMLYKIDMWNIPTEVSVHLVRHKVGVEHFVRSNRPDRGGNAKADRQTPVNHSMIINAQALISMARKRFCYQAAASTRAVMRLVHEAIREVDPDMAGAMVPDCYYRGGVCFELRCCHRVPGVIHFLELDAPNFEWRWAS